MEKANGCDTNEEAGNKYLKPLEPSDIEQIRKGQFPIRRMDLEEIKAYCLDISPREAIVKSIETSEMCWKLVDPVDGAVFGVGGVNQYTKIDWIPWFVGTQLIEERPFRFARISKKALGVIASLGNLMNYCTTTNTTTISWLKWLGFTFPEPSHKVCGKEWIMFMRIGDEPCA